MEGWDHRILIKINYYSMVGTELSLATFAAHHLTYAFRMRQPRAATRWR
jgi:hypothetical protein